MVEKHSKQGTAEEKLNMQDVLSMRSSGYYSQRTAGAKNATESAFKFAKEREQFSRSITEFDMIKSKFARMVTSCWEADNVNYMTSGSIDNAIEKLDKKYFFESFNITESDYICSIVQSNE